MALSRVEDEIFRLGGFSVGINWVGFAGDVATRIRRVSRYHWGHSRPTRIGTYLDHHALPAWANGSLTGTTSQTRQLEFSSGQAARPAHFFAHYRNDYSLASFFRATRKSRLRISR